MVAILFASAAVVPGHLQMTVIEWADPDLRPRRRDDERADALQDSSVLELLAAPIRIGEGLASLVPPIARDRVAHVTQSRGFRRAQRSALSDLPRVAAQIAVSASDSGC